MFDGMPTEAVVISTSNSARIRGNYNDDVVVDHYDDDSFFIKQDEEETGELHIVSLSRAEAEALHLVLSTMLYR